MRRPTIKINCLKYAQFLKAVDLLNVYRIFRYGSMPLPLIIAFHIVVYIVFVILVLLTAFLSLSCADNQPV